MFCDLEWQKGNQKKGLDMGSLEGIPPYGKGTIVALLDFYALSSLFLYKIWMAEGVVIQNNGVLPTKTTIKSNPCF